MAATSRPRTTSIPATNGHNGTPGTGTGGQPTFGIELEVQMARDGVDVPPIMVKCCKAIEKYGITSQGIYRISGMSSKVQELKAKLDKGWLRLLVHSTLKVDLSIQTWMLWTLTHRNGPPTSTISQASSNYGFVNFRTHYLHSPFVKASLTPPVSLLVSH